jgi:hypothetical protein
MIIYVLLLHVIGTRHPEQLRAIENLLSPMLHSLLDPDFPAVCEYFEKMLEFVTFFTFYTTPISDSCWVSVITVHTNTHRRFVN